MIKSILTVALLFSTTAFAAPTVGDRIWAVSLASQLKKISKATDLLDLPMDDRDANLVKAQIKRGQLKDFSRPKITMPNETTVMISVRHQMATLDFRDFHRRVVYLNNHRILLKPNLDYLHFRFLVEQTLRQKTAWLQWLIPDANADDSSNALIDTTTTGISVSARNLRIDNLPNGDDVETALIKAYQYDAQSARRRAQKTNKLNFGVVSFACAGKKVSHVYDGYLIYKGKNENAGTDGDDLQFDGKNYLFKNDTCEKGIKFRANLDLIGEANPDCPQQPNPNNIKRSQFQASQTTTWTFLPVAQACCQKAGCADHVNSTLQQLKQGLLSPTGSSDSGRDGGGAVNDSNN